MEPLASAGFFGSRSFQAGNQVATKRSVFFQGIKWGWNSVKASELAKCWRRSIYFSEGKDWNFRRQKMCSNSAETPLMLFKIERLVYVGQLWKHSWNKVIQRVYLPHLPRILPPNLLQPHPIFYQKLCQDTARSSTAKFKGCSAGKDTSKGGAAISPGRTNRKLSGLNPNRWKKPVAVWLLWFTRISESWWFGRWK